MDNRDDRAARHERWARDRNGSGRSRRTDSRRTDSRRDDSRRDGWDERGGDERGGDEPTWTRNAPEGRPPRTPDRDRPSRRAIAPDRWLDSRGRAGASTRRASKDPAKGRG